MASALQLLAVAYGDKASSTAAARVLRRALVDLTAEATS
jgi:hypothetical protein